jgi:ribosomal protein L40E
MDQVMADNVFCGACGAEMSKEAVACPKCGQPNEASKKKMGIGLMLGVLFVPPIFAWFTLRKGFSTKARVISFLWMVIALGGAAGTQSDNPARKGSTASSKESAPVEVITVKSSVLYQEYMENEIAADGKYKGKYVEVSGAIDDIGKDIMDEMYITLPGDGFLGVQVYFPKSDSQVVGGLKKGQRVSVVCKIDGKFGNVMCKDAALK